MAGDQKALRMQLRAESPCDAQDRPPASPRLVSVGERAPKGGGHVVVGDSYSVAGKLYTPRENPRYSATGLASWYGEAFHGRLTANGEIYDVNGLTAAGVGDIAMDRLFGSGVVVAHGRASGVWLAICTCVHFDIFGGDRSRIMGMVAEEPAEIVMLPSRD